MKALIALLALALLIVPMLAGIRHIRKLPPPEPRDENPTES